MLFREMGIPGAYEIELEPVFDERGFFARTWCSNEFESHGLASHLSQCSVSFSTREGTLRGMHYQVAPFEETKLVRCLRGRIYDVIVDLRPESSAFKRWIGVLLTAEKRNMLYVPKRCAHGFLTLEERTEVAYQISEQHSPESARGVRWDDPAFAIAWPAKVEVISERDRTYPNFE